LHSLFMSSFISHCLPSLCVSFLLLSFLLISPSFAASFVPVSVLFLPFYLSMSFSQSLPVSPLLSAFISTCFHSFLIPSYLRSFVSGTRSDDTDVTQRF
jgi:hypothetical protein